MSTVIYVAIVEGDQDRGYSAFFPDLPGCVTAAETMVELPSAARDALCLHLQGMTEDGAAFPEPTALEDIKADTELKEVGRILVDAEVEDAPVRVNISIGAQFLKRVDVAAEARGMSRSGFLVEAARAALESRDGRLGVAERWAQVVGALALDNPQHPEQPFYHYWEALNLAGCSGMVGSNETSEGHLEALALLDLPTCVDRLAYSTAVQRSLSAAAGHTVKVPLPAKPGLYSKFAIRR